MCWTCYDKVTKTLILHNYQPVHINQLVSIVVAVFSLTASKLRFCNGTIGGACSVLEYIDCDPGIDLADIRDTNCHHAACKDWWLHENTAVWIPLSLSWKKALLKGMKMWLSAKTGTTEEVTCLGFVSYTTTSISKKTQLFEFCRHNSSVWGTVCEDLNFWIALCSWFCVFHKWLGYSADLHFDGSAHMYQGNEAHVLEQLLWDLRLFCHKVTNDNFGFKFFKGMKKVTFGNGFGVHGWRHACRTHPYYGSTYGRRHLQKVGITAGSLDFSGGGVQAGPLGSTPVHEPSQNP